MIVGETNGRCIKCQQLIKDDEFVTWTHGGEEHTPSCPNVLTGLNTLDINASAPVVRSEPGPKYLGSAMYELTY